MKDLIELANPNSKRDLEKSHSLFDRLWPALASEVAKILAAPSEDDSPIERIQGHWWSKLHVGPLDDGIGFVTISSDPTTDMPYLTGNHYYPDGSRGAEWKSKGACVIESQRDVIFFYYWEGSHRNENPVYVGSGEIRFSAPVSYTHLTLPTNREV